jgi:hypothetical protein
MVTKKGFVLALIASTLAAATAAQEKDVLDELRNALGPAPTSLRIVAAGSEYVPAGSQPGERQHVRIPAVTQELDVTAARLEQQFQISEMRPGTAPTTRTRNDIATAGAPWTDQYPLWTTPYGFLAAASSQTPRISNETVLGRTYRVITVTPVAGHDVRGYINENNMLERTRTEFERAGTGTVHFEAIYLDWSDHGGVRYPDMIIQKENNELSRILVVDTVIAGGAAAASGTQ